jgi:hypothetical protein
MASAQDMRCIDLPIVLRDRLARGREHHRQADYELIEAALDYWDDNGGWDLADRRARTSEPS